MLRVNWENEMLSSVGRVSEVMLLMLPRRGDSFDSIEFKLKKKLLFLCSIGLRVI